MLAENRPDRPAFKIEVTEKMIEAGVHTLTGFNLNPGFQEVNWSQIVRSVYGAILEAA